MQIRLGYDIELEIPAPTVVLAVLNVHPSRTADLLEPDEIRISPNVLGDSFLDSFGNRCVRFPVSEGTLRLSNLTLIQDSGEPDPVPWGAGQIPVDQLPPD